MCSGQKKIHKKKKRKEDFLKLTYDIRDPSSLAPVLSVSRSLRETGGDQGLCDHCLVSVGECTLSVVERCMQGVSRGTWLWSVTSGVVSP